MPEKGLGKRPMDDDDSDDGDEITEEKAPAKKETERQGCSFQPTVVSGLKVGLSEEDFNRIVGTRIRVSRRGSRIWRHAKVDSYDENTMKHCIVYEDGDKDKIDLTKWDFVIESRSSEVGIRRHQCTEEMAKTLLTRTPAGTFNDIKLDDRTSGKVIGKRVKVYSDDKGSWLVGRIMSYDEHRRRHLVAFEDDDNRTEEMDLRGQVCYVELKYGETAQLLKDSSK